MKLSNIIKNYRNRYGLSLRAFADKCDLSFQYIAKLESDEIDSPTINAINNIAKAMNISIDKLLHQMDDMVVDVSMPHPEPVITLNVYSPLSCGNGLFVEDNVISVITLPKSMFPAKKKDLFAQYADGDSMIDCGIYDGDLLVFSKELCESGDIGCFCIDENVATCKKLRILDNQILLMPCNDKYDPIPVEPEKFKCVGKLVLKISKEK